MPYKDADRQREEVNKGVKKCLASRKMGRPIGTSTYDSPEMIASAISKQEKRLVMLQQHKEEVYTQLQELRLENPKDERIEELTRAYHNSTSYIYECRARMRKLLNQMKDMLSE